MIASRIRQEAGKAIERAVERTIADVAEGESENEADTTSRLASRIKDELNGLDLGDVRIHASVRTLQDRGPGAAEKRYGADLLIVLRIDVDGTEVTKGVLVQSKRTHRDGVRLQGETRVTMTVTTPSKHLRQQCAKMQQLTAESFVWVYGPTDVRSARATSITETQHNTTVRSSRLEEFFGDMLDCTIGDTRLQAVDNDTLESLIDGLDAAGVLTVEVLDGDTEPTLDAQELRG